MLRLTWLLLFALLCQLVASQPEDPTYVTAGTSFSFAFPPVLTVEDGGACLLFFSARDDSVIDIAMGSDDSTVQIFVAERTTTNFEIDCSMRTTSFLEMGKAIHITATTPISIYAMNVESNTTTESIMSMDAWPVWPALRGDETYRIAGTVPNCEGVHPVILITAINDNTLISVYNRTGDLFSSFTILDKYDTFTVTGNLEGDEDYSGFLVESQNAFHPISVVVGSPCVLMCTDPDPQSCPGTQMYDSMPPVTGLGDNYITTPLVDLNNEEVSSYHVRMVSNQDDTRITFPGFPFTDVIYEGESTEFDVIPSRFAARFNSSHPTLLVQYNMGQHAIGHDTGAFMFTTTPNEAYSNYVIFQTPSFVMDRYYLAIIVAKFPPEDLWLNGDTDATTEFSWQEVTGYHYAYAYMELEPGSTHEIMTFDEDGLFAAYLYGYGDQIGFGVNLGENVIAELPPPPPPRPTPPPIGFQTPLLQITLAGMFVSHDDSDWSEMCTLAAASNLNSRTLTMMTNINNQMPTLCPFAPETTVFTSSTTLVTVDNEGFTTIDFFVNSLSDIPTIDTWHCGVNIGIFTEDHTNWGIPLLPMEPGCPFPQFTPVAFNNTDIQWFCDNTNAASSADSSVTPGAEQFTATAPPQVINLVADYETDDGSEMPPVCILEYSRQLDTSIARQMTDVNNMLLNRQLCFWFQGVQIVIANRLFTSSGTSGSAIVNYRLLGVPTQSYDDIELCVQEVNQFLQPFDHGWGEPLLVGEPGCPFPLFADNFFTGSNDWEC